MNARRLLAAALALAGLTAPLAQAAPDDAPARAPIVVNSIGDAADREASDGRCDTGAPTSAGDPECTLRAAIGHAGALPGPDTIVVAVAAWDLGAGAADGTVRIAPATALPEVAEELVIDGAVSAPLTALAPDRVILDGAALGGAAALTATAPTVLRSVRLVDFAVAGLVTTPDAARPERSTTPEIPLPESDPQPPPGAPDAEPAPGATPAPAPEQEPPQQQTEPETPAATPIAPSPRRDPEGGTVLGVAVVVNSTGDGSDIVPGDGVCATGSAISASADECTLRAALEEADASALVDTVIFAIPARDFGRAGDGRWTIRPASPLPTVATPVTIDAATQSGAACAGSGSPPAPAVVIDAGGGVTGLRVRGEGVTIRGLAIDGAATAVHLEATAAGATLICNRLGIDAAGTGASVGLVAAVHVDGAAGARIGGVEPDDGNMLGAGTRGSVRITGQADDTTVIGDTIVGDAGPVIAATAAAGLGTPRISAAEGDTRNMQLSLVPDVAPGAYRLEVLAAAQGDGGATILSPLTLRSVSVTGDSDPVTVSIPATDADLIFATLTADPTGPDLAATSALSGGFFPLSVSQIRGTVREDVDGDGSVSDDGTGVADVDVRVFADQGNGRPDAGDPVIGTTLTDVSGAWMVAVPGDGTYWAAVDSRDIVPASGLRGGFSPDDVWADQTYASAGAVRDDGVSYSYSASAGPLPGGARPAAGDGFPVLPVAEHVHRVIVSGADVTGVDTGFSFSAITNTLDDPSGSVFGDPASWTSFDADSAGIGVNPEGYEQAVYDGRYVYFTPDQRTGGRHGEVLRFDTEGAYTSPASWESFDAGDSGVGSDPDGYAGAVFDGRYVYFSPDHNGAGRHGEVLRYDTEAPFGAAGSWSAYDPGANGVGTDPDGYRGAEFDGRYVYFAPDHNGTARHGEVLRLDTQAAFASTGAWETFDPGANGVGTDPDGYSDVLFDGRHLYFSPLDNGSGAHGEVLRYDVRAPFAAGSSWTAYDPGADGVGTDPDGFSSLASDGRYVYFAPSDAGAGPSGEVMRLDTTAPFASASSWATFDPGTAGLGSGAVGFGAAEADGRYLYLLQDRDGGGPAGRVVRFDTRAAFASVGSWEMFDPAGAGVGGDPEGARGAAFDGRHLYVPHFNNGTDFSSEVLRLDTARTGQGSLRRFLTNADAISGTQSSVFAIPVTDPGWSASPAGFTVSPTAALPAATDPVVIDATTQTQYASQGRPVVAIDGTGAGSSDGLTFAAASGASQVRGLAIGGFAGAGIVSSGDDAIIAGNWIGLAPDGSTAAPNGGVGIRVEGDGTTVGGAIAADRNVVSGNGDDGIRLVGAAGVVSGNRIGTDATGVAAVANGDDGVDARGAGGLVGGTTGGEANVISGNADDGVSLSAGASATVVQGNRIGVGADGSTSLGNGDLGVWVDTSANRVGGTAAGTGNTISANGRAGVLVNAGTDDNAILRNAMSANGGLGIDLNASAITSDAPSDGATANDAGDGDTGANGLLNSPELGAPTEAGGTATVAFDLDVPAGAYRVEFFSNPAGADPSGSGEGGAFAAAVTVTHTGSGTEAFTHAVPTAAGEVITATATAADGAGETSEFSAPVTVLAGNDAPVVTILSATTISEDAPLAFHAGTASEMSVNDADAGSGALAVTLTATHGTLTLGDTTGLTFTTGDGTGDAAMEFTGALTAINAALDGSVFTPATEYAGAASVQLDVDDQGNTGAGGARTDSGTLAITVTGDNDAPVHTLPVSVPATAEDTPITLSGGDAISVSDADAGGSPLSVTLTGTGAAISLSGTTGLTFGSGDGTADATMIVSGTLAAIGAALDGMVVIPAPDHTGTASVRIQTDDLGNTGPGGPRSDDDTLTVTVTAVNDMPVNVVPATQTVAGGTPLVFSSGGGNALGVTDVDAGSGSIRVVLTMTGGTLTLSGTSGLSFIAGDGSLDTGMIFTGSRADAAAALEGATFLPAAGFSGTATIQIDTDDLGNTGAGGARSDSDSFDITVTAATSPPVLAAIGPKTVAEGDTLALAAGATDPDLPGDTLTWSLVGAPAGAAIDASTGAFTWTPSEAQGPGAHTFAVVVTDAGSPPASDSETITVTVTEVNARPLLDAIPDAANGEGDTVSVRPTGIDPDIPADTLTWSAAGLPPGLSMNPLTGEISGTVASGATAGSPYPVTVTLEDALGASDTASFTWTVAVTNSAPVLAAISPESADEMTLVRATARATDPDGDPLRYSLRKAPAGARIDAASGRITWTPSEAQGPGRYSFGVVATDDGSPAMEAERPLSVTVREVNRAPGIAPIGERRIAVGERLRVETEATDPDRPADRLSHRVAGPAGMTIDDAGVITWTPGAGDIGEATATVTVTDDGTPARSGSARLAVTVTAAPSATPSPVAPASGGGAPATAGPTGGPTRPVPSAPQAPGATPGTDEPATPAVTPGPAPAPATSGLTPAQLASRRLGSGLLEVTVPTATAPRSPDRPVGISVSTPVRVISAATELSIPLRLLSLGGAWAGLIIGFIAMRRRNRRPYLVTGIPHDEALPVYPERRTDSDPRFLLRHDAGPVWSRGPARRRRGTRWIEVETPLGTGFTDAAHLLAPPTPGDAPA